MIVVKAMLILTSCLHEVRGELACNIAWEQHRTPNINEEKADEGEDGDDPEDVCDDSQPLELIVQLMQSNRYNAATLWYKEPLGVEGPERYAKCADTVWS